MCMAATYRTKEHYFGRNLDYEFSYGERIVVVPRRHRFDYRHVPADDDHLAMIGMATVIDGIPLYFDATNEKGLSMAGLNFTRNAHYHPITDDGRDNIASFELITWVLGHCSTVDEARRLLEHTNVTDEAFNDKLLPSQLHWMIANRDSCIVLEVMADGMHIHDNPVGILTNNPPFPFHMVNLANHMAMSPEQPVNRYSDIVDLDLYSRGMGAMGLPGDLSSPSRFVKAAFTKMNSISDDTDESGITQFFHIMASVEQQMGCCKVEDGYEHTLYTSCCNTDRGVYYYRTYGNSQICGVDMHRTDLDSTELHEFPLVTGQHMMMQN